MRDNLKKGNNLNKENRTLMNKMKSLKKGKGKVKTLAVKISSMKEIWINKRRISMKVKIWLMMNNSLRMYLIRYKNNKSIQRKIVIKQEIKDLGEIKRNRYQRNFQKVIRKSLLKLLIRKEGRIKKEIIKEDDFDII